MTPQEAFDVAGETYVEVEYDGNVYIIRGEGAQDMKDGAALRYRMGVHLTEEQHVLASLAHARIVLAMVHSAVHSGESCSMVLHEEARAALGLRAER